MEIAIAKLHPVLRGYQWVIFELDIGSNDDSQKLFLIVFLGLIDVYRASFPPPPTFLQTGYPNQGIQFHLYPT